MKRCFALLVTVAIVSIGFSAMANNGPSEIVFDNKQGTITFNHQQHQADNKDCTICHHQGLETPTCRSCHDGKTAPIAKKVFHKLCKDCHKKSDSEKVKGSCAVCHK